MPIYGAINILYKNTAQGRRFLVVKNTRTGNMTFVSGARRCVAHSNGATRAARRARR